MLRHLGCCLLMSCLLALTGCSDGKVSVYPVTGKLLVNGQPAVGAKVVIVPTETLDERAMKMRSAAKVDENGEFRLTTYVRGDGAPAGKYKLCIKWMREYEQRQPRAGEEENFDDQRGQRRYNALDPAMFRPETSQYEIEVKEEDNVLEPIDIPVQQR